MAAKAEKYTGNTFSAMVNIAARMEPSLDHTRLNAIRKSVETTFTKSMGRAITAGFGREGLMKMSRTLTSAGEVWRAQVVKVENAQEAIAKMAEGEQKKIAQAELLADQKAMDRLEATYKKENLHLERIIKRREVAMEEVARLSKRSMSEAAEEFGEGIGKTFESMKSFDMSSIFKSVGKNAGARGAQLAAAGEEKGGLTGKAMAGIGKSMAGLGSALLVIGGIVAGFAALAKIILDADAQVKEFNKALFESGVSASDMTGNFLQMGDALDRVRKSFVGSSAAFDFNRLWGTSAKDHLEILGAYANSGQTLREFTAGVKDAREETERLQDATAAAITYAKLFGTSNTEMAEHIGTYMEELGLTLDGVTEKLSAVNMMAREAGFGTKRFFNMVLQATTGMGMYNVRIEEAGSLLVRLGKIMGAKTGGEFMQGLGKSLTGESMQERRKRIMITGKGRTKQVFAGEAKMTSEDFTDKVVKAGKQNELIAALKAAGVGGDVTAEGKLDPQKLVESLGKMSQDQWTSMLTEAKSLGNDDLVRQLNKLVEASRGAQGGTENMAASFSGLGAASELTMKLLNGEGVLGKPLHELTSVQIDASEAMTGVSGEMREQLRLISRVLHGSHKKLTELTAATPEGGYSEEQKAEQQKLYGAYIENGKRMTGLLNANGKLVEGSQREIGDSFVNLVQAQPKVFEDAMEAAKGEDILLAQEMVTQTTAMSEILKQGVEGWLEYIAGVVDSILNVFINKNEAAARQSALNTITTKMEGIRKEESVKSTQISDVNKRMLGSRSLGEKEELAQERADLEVELEGIRGRKTQAMQSRKNLVNTPAVSKWAWDKSTRGEADFLREAEGNATAPALKVQGVAPKEDALLRGQFEQGAEAKLMEVYLKALRDEMLRMTNVHRVAEGMPAETELFPHMEATLKELAFKLAHAAAKQTTGTGAVAADVTEEETRLFGGLMPVLTDIQKVGGDASNMVGVLKSQWGRIAAGGSTLADGGGLLAENTPEQTAALADLEAAEAIEVDTVLSKTWFGKQMLRWKAEAKLGAADLAATLAAPERMATAVVDGLAAKSIAADLQEIGFPAADTTKMAETIAKSGKLDETVRVAFSKLSAEKQTAMRARGFGGLAGLLPSPAQDFLMQIGDGGRVKFAQRIDSADEVTAVASKAGGAIDKAGRRGTSSGAGGSGGGGTHHHHYYNDASGVYSQWQKLARAKAL